MFSSPGEIAFSIGSLNIYYYGIIVAFGALSGFLLSYFIAKKYYDIDAENLYSIVSLIIISGFIFARLYYCLLNFGYYSSNLSEIFFIRGGGLSIQGGIFGALICGIVYCKVNNFPVLKFADIIAYGLVLSQSIGRWGNFFNSEAFGYPTQNFISVFIPISKRPLDFVEYSTFHPTFLYESVFDLLILLILFFIVRRFTKNKDGLIFTAYLILYSVARFFIEGMRTDSVLNIGNIPIAQVVCILTIIGAIIFSAFLMRFPNRH